MTRRWIGGVFGNTIGTDTDFGNTRGVFSMEQQYYLIQEGGWGPALGGAESNPASNAKQIYDTGNRLNGIYWLKHGSGSAYQAYCWIDANSGGGYQLVGKIDSGNPSAWRWSGSNWSATSAVNESNCQDLNNTSGLNRGYYEYTLVTGFRMGLHSSAVSTVTNYLSEAKTGNTAKHFFTNQSSCQNGRSNFKSWLSGAGLDNSFNSNYDAQQANCNSSGFANSTPSSNTRWGTTGNNEGDCNSNDSCIGFGGTASGCNMAAGGEMTHPANLDRFGIGYIFVQ